MKKIPEKDQKMLRSLKDDALNMMASNDLFTSSSNKFLLFL